jgi:ParB family chromosome partitioning protein
MPDIVHHIPIHAIDEAALVRDRLGMDPEALQALARSIAVDGLRMPVEVFALAAPREGEGGEKTHGLISGFRRLAAVRALAAEGVAGQESIAAFVREPADMAAALAAMVEENEVRAEISAWERGALLVKAVQLRLFDDVEGAIAGLHPEASAVVRTRLRALALAAGELDYVFAAPERFTQGEVMRLAAACRAGFGEAIEAAVCEVPRKDHARQWEAVGPVLAEAAGAAPGTLTGAGPCRVAELRGQLRVRRVKVKGGWSFRFTGRMAVDDMMSSLFIDIENRFGVA